VRPSARRSGRSQTARSGSPCSASACPSGGCPTTAPIDINLSSKRLFPA
jgi:hypothetical protein